jgi:uncharacterized protein
MGMSKVLFAPVPNLRAAIPKLIEQSGFLEKINCRRRLGIKVHFGEDGNHNYLDPSFVRAAVEVVCRRVTDCVLLETSTLYRGRRATAKTHLSLAHEHGFTLASVMMPIDIIDGRQGEASYSVPVDLKLVKEAHLGRRLKHVPTILNMAHFKGHFVTGFGGVLKNLAMGLASKRGKLEMHCLSKPNVNPDRCTSCGDCVEYCPSDAIDFVHEVARIGRSCSGCAACITVCRQGAIGLDWGEAAENVGLKVTEYALAVLRDRVALHLNFVINVTPNCDCMAVTEKPIMPDVGIFASLDPVACEQAAFDRAGPALKKTYPKLIPEKQIEHAEKIGLGSRKYELITVKSDEE